MDLIVRRPTVDDAEVLHDAVLASLDHLRPWMPWVSFEPMTLEERRALISTWGEAYALFAGGRCVGTCGLHDRIGDGGREIGYWVRVDEIGKGYATAAAGHLVEVARSMAGVRYVEIHHDKANVRSRRVPQKLGFTLVREIPDSIAAPGECGISVEWRLDL